MALPPTSTRLAIAALATAAVLVGAAVVARTGGEAYEVSFTVANAGQLIPGNEVRVGGVAVGKVEDLVLTADGQAEVRLSIDDDSLIPLRYGTKAAVRASSLSGVANRYVSLTPGRNDAVPIASGGAIASEDDQAPVELDQVLNSIDPGVQRDLGQLVRHSADALAGAGEDVNRGLEVLSPFLTETAATARELAGDERLLTRFLIEGASLVSAAASRPAELERLVADTLATSDALASRSGELEALVRELPDALGALRASLPGVGDALGDLDELVLAAEPVAGPLSRFLPLLALMGPEARPVVADLRARVSRVGPANDLTEIVAGLQALDRAATPAARSLTRAIDDTLPIVRDARPYTPDFVGGIFNGFGGTTGGYYDANGHYARVAIHAGLASLTGAGSLVALSPDRSGLAGYRTGVLARCPGAATQRASDGSNPYLDRADFPCRPEDTPR